MAGALAGRVALVTGASSGIGEATAIALAEAGAVVAISARRIERLQDVARRIEAAGGRALALPGDVTRPEDATRMVEETIRQLGRIDILVNNAGIIEAGGIENADVDDWRRVIDTNLMAAVYTCKAAIPPMKAQGSGDIIIISSTAARRVASPFNSYSASKFGLWAMTEGMRQEIAKYGIRVSNIEPGFTSTECSEGITEPGFRDMMRKHINQEGAMKPEDIAAGVVFVASLPARANVPEIQIRPTIDASPI